MSRLIHYLGNFEENIGFIEGNAWQYALWFRMILMD
jgi:hypothetical protein